MAVAFAIHRCRVWAFPTRKMVPKLNIRRRIVVNPGHEVDQDCPEMVLALAPGPVIDAHDPQGVGAAGHRPGALFQDAQDRVVTHRHAEAAQEAFAAAASERVADPVDDVTQATRVPRMSPAHLGESFREHLGLTPRVPTPPAADAEAQRDGRPLRGQILQRPRIATMASMRPMTACGTPTLSTE